MAKPGRFFYLHKVIFFNILFALFVLATDYYLLDLLPHTREFSFYLGVALLVAVFLDFAGIYYKTRLLYSFAFNKDRKIPFYLRVTVLPRLLITGVVLLLAASAMGMLKSSDFILLPVTILATVKEFWVKSTILNPVDAETEKIGAGKIWLGEFFLFVSLCITYLGFWYVYLQDAPKLLLKAKHPQNYIFVALIFLLFQLAYQMPHLLEEYFRHKPRSMKVIAVISILLPTIAILFVFFKMAYLT